MRVERGADDRGWSVPGAAALPLWERTGPGGQGAVGKRRAGRLGGGGGERQGWRGPAGWGSGRAVSAGMVGKVWSCTVTRLQVLS